MTKLSNDDKDRIKELRKSGAKLLRVIQRLHPEVARGVDEQLVRDGDSLATMAQRVQAVIDQIDSKKAEWKR